MARPIDPARRAKLLDAAIDYAIEHGLSDLTLRPLAEALGVMPNTLVHHFGSKEALLSAILNGVRDRLREVGAQVQGEAGLTGLERVWQWSSDPEHAEFFRSFFESYGLALRKPRQFHEFLDRVVADWVSADSSAQTTLELAVVRGLLLDLLTTGERQRVDAAFALFLDRINSSTGQRGFPDGRRG